jgi:glutathione reductase (NADPH)
LGIDVADIRFRRKMLAHRRNTKLSNGFDLIVIGGGSGGIAHARRAAEYGARVAVIEYGRLGGTCVNVGCVPKKVMWYTAGQMHGFEHAADYGFDVAVNGHDWAALKASRDAYVTRLNGIYESNLDRSGVTYISGVASFVDDHTVAVGDEHYQAERIVIATGGRPMVPNIPGAELGITSDDFFALEERPQRVLVAGSGYIAVELAGVFNGLGSEVKLVVRKDSIIRSFDAMLGEQLMEAMEKDGVEIETLVIPGSLEKTADGLLLHAEDGRTFGPVDTVLWAIGREPNVGQLAVSPMSRTWSPAMQASSATSVVSSPRTRCSRRMSSIYSRLVMSPGGPR